MEAKEKRIIELQSQLTEAKMAITRGPVRVNDCNVILHVRMK